MNKTRAPVNQVGSAIAEQLGTPWESFAQACTREPVELRGMEVSALSYKILDVIYTHNMNFWLNGVSSPFQHENIFIL